jgi:hypothetical protein
MKDICVEETPGLEEVSAGHYTACHFKYESREASLHELESRTNCYGGQE